MDMLRQDLRYAARSLLGRPAFAFLAIATLTLGIGINAGMFSVVRAVLLEPLPYAEPDRLVRVHHVNPAGGVDDGAFSPDDFDDFAAGSGSFEQLAAFWYAPGVSETAVTGAGDAALLETAYVGAAFFPALGVAPLLGRGLSETELREGSDRVAVLSHSEWTQRFGADRDIVGSTITLNGGPYTVIGVMPPAFAYPSEAVQIWLPLSLITPEYIPRHRSIRYLGAVGRLAPETDAAAATTELSGLAARLADEHPGSNEGWRAVRLQSVRDEVLGNVRSPLLVLSAAVGFVLLIACANLLNLLLARASSRRSEFALRAALGAAPRRLIRQIVTESVVLAVAGAGFGLLGAWWLIGLLGATAGADFPRLANVRIDGVVVAFSMVLGVLVGTITGAIPAWRAVADGSLALREAGRSGTDGRSRQRLRGALIASEMALAVVLVVAAGLMLRSLATLLRVDPGFQTEQVLAVTLKVPNHQATSLQRSIDYRNTLMERLAALPGVEQVAAAKSLPLEGGGEAFEFEMPGTDARFKPEAGIMIVSPGYFSTLGIPVVRGRGLEPEDRMEVPVLVVNETAARRYWPGEDAVGHRVTLGNLSFEVVGVVGDVRHAGLHTPPVSAGYVPIDMMPRLTLRLLLKTQSDPRSLIAPVRTAIRQLDEAQPIAEIVPLDATIRRAAAREQFLTTLLGAFAALALLLAAIGIYGVVAYSVAQRMHEMGIRMALGARPQAVLRMVLAQSALWWGSGLMIGLVAAFVVMRVLRSLVYGVSVTDPLTFLLVAVLLGGAATLASAVPALRASRADPAATFR